ncbi:MAG: ATP-binding cassette domain-containing protein [Betaproteobacteria bacterium]|nr:ATP-binding cassette domain-containing protein [Betaproteobacteria bacterium]
MLKLENLARHFGGIKAVDGIDFEVKRGEILGLIGPNGSGKSTTINLAADLECHGLHKSPDPQRACTSPPPN